ncbi:MAG: TRAP transporter permease [Natronospirillum sp.]|uniref:TRAP transporter permease n=1 Tax=Natronospirillum sp. TaxID=2812955 RepID=UPI0025FF6592|nr:TRAP transporter permease [Natronospirillum sp.]MCH8551167.1 TRAP transporter permease [Natronospirillum sp.]
MSVANDPSPETGTKNIAAGVDAENIASNQRVISGALGVALSILCAAYTLFHVWSMNFYPLEPWIYRISHVGGGLALGFLLYSAHLLTDDAPAYNERKLPAWIALALGSAGILYGLLCMFTLWISTGGQSGMGAPQPPAFVLTFGIPLLAGTTVTVLTAWLFPAKRRGRLDPADVLLALSALAVAMYFIYYAPMLRLRAGTGMALPSDMYASMVGVLLILELTRRLAGLALVIIAAVFVAYAFIGPWLPGILQHRGYSMQRFFSYIYTDNGILGPTTAISSTYIILFITFAAFLQASRVGEYFVNFAFAAAGHTRGGPAKVAVFGSGLMGMINGTSAGNVVSTGSLTIPLMKRVGYKPQTSAAVEAAASSGGQILPPIMGAGAFIMAEITGIRYTEIVVAAIIPALLYFLSVYFMVDKEALRNNMKGLPRSELPKFRVLAKQVYLFAPIVILIVALFMGYSVIRAGTLAMAAAAMVSWLTPFRMGPRAIFYAFELAARMSLQLVAVCAAAGIIVGVIALTGVGTRFSSMLLAIAAQNQLLALFFAMCVAIILGMGMPTTAAYAVAASVIAPGLIRMGIDPLTAHFFIFYFAVMSAITPPVALAAFAGAGIAQSDPMKTSVESFKIGLAAFVVPFMFFYNSALLMQGTPLEIIHVVLTAALGIFLLASAVQAWFFGSIGVILRLILLVAALFMIQGGWISDIIGLGAAALVLGIKKMILTTDRVARGLD